MKKTIRIASVLLLAASLAGCEGPCQKIGRITGPALSSGTADFTTYVSVGTSISTGYQSSGVVNRHQVYSFPAYFARQIGKTVQLDGQGTFSFPAVDGNGLPPLLQLRGLSPLNISNSGLAPGTAINTTYPTAYTNMAVPGSIIFDFGNTARYASGLFPLVTRGMGTISAQMLSLNPTFISFEFGANEVLGPASAGSSVQASPTTAPEYAAMLTAAMNAIHLARPDAKLALFTVPVVTTIPLFTTLKPYTVSLTTGAVVPLVGLDPVHDLVLLTAKAYLAVGDGIPVGAYNYVNPAAPGTGNALPGSVVLTAAEQATLLTAVNAMNAAVDSVSQRPWIAKVDMGGLLSDIAANGYMVGSTKYTSAYVTGGIFSLDGVHPTDLAHAVLANTMIDAVNARFGSTVPRVDLNTAGTATASSIRPVLGTDDLKGMQVDGLETSLRSLYGR
jgi:lysophospholipase L1-like esterase